MSGAEIKEITGDDLLEIITDKHPSLPKSTLEKLAVKVLSPDRMQQLGEKEVKPLTRHEKQMNELKFYLKHKTFPIIILQGPAGVGKSHAVRQTLGENQFYEGAAGLLAWLKSYGDKPFLADEMNTQDWDFLAGIGRPNQIVVYQGIEYELTRNHQIIGTCNPVGPRYPGRSYLKVIQNLAVTIAFKEPTDDFYKQVVLQPKLTAAFPMITTGL